MKCLDVHHDALLHVDKCLHVHHNVLLHVDKCLDVHHDALLHVDKCYMYIMMPCYMLVSATCTS